MEVELFLSPRDVFINANEFIRLNLWMCLCLCDFLFKRLSALNSYCFSSSFTSLNRRGNGLSFPRMYWKPFSRLWVSTRLASSSFGHLKKVFIRLSQFGFWSSNIWAYIPLKLLVSESNCILKSLMLEYSKPIVFFLWCITGKNLSSSLFSCFLLG